MNLSPKKYESKEIHSIKFITSEKATKFCIQGKISQNFVAFSEDMNIISGHRRKNQKNSFSDYFACIFLTSKKILYVTIKILSIFWLVGFPIKMVINT